MSNQEKPSNNQPKDIAVIERRGLFGQMTVQPLEIRGNDSHSHLDFISSWARFLSLPSGRMESVFNLGIWGFTGGTIACFVHDATWLLIPSIFILAVLGVLSYYVPELTPILVLRIAVVTILIIATFVVL